MSVTVIMIDSFLISYVIVKKINLNEADIVKVQLLLMKEQRN